MGCAWLVVNPAGTPFSGLLRIDGDTPTIALKARSSVDWILIATLLVACAAFRVKHNIENGYVGRSGYGALWVLVDVYLVSDDDVIKGKDRDVLTTGAHGGKSALVGAGHYVAGILGRTPEPGSLQVGAGVGLAIGKR